MTTKTKMGGRQSTKKFGDADNSLVNTINLPGSDPAIAARYYRNAKEYSQQCAEFRSWAASGFMSGSSVTDAGRGDIL